jgi:leucyl/phenylalanyl-tRNA--protein transferase
MPIFRLNDHIIFPPAHLAEDGLLAVGGDLSSERLLAAYKNGIFPWYNEDDPILWWSPDPRMLLFPEKIHIARRLRRTIRQGIFQVTADHCFEAVITNCADTPRPGQGGTWILPEMIEAYNRLHKLGYAHSIECWKEDNLVGGLYGVSIGMCFFAESMYSHADNASKMAVTALALQSQRWGFAFIDCQMHTPHLARLGGQTVSRQAFLKLVRQSVRRPTHRGKWNLDADLLAGL